ncbi:MAG: ROK family protein [Elusimicrobiota bacterium]
MKKYIVGVDLGGTKVAAAVFNRTGKIIGARVKLPTEKRFGKHSLLQSIYNTINMAIRDAGIKINMVEGIGLGSPGPLDIESGRLLTPINLKPLHGFNLRRCFENKYKVPVRLQNDANIFVLGEAVYGAGKKCKIVYGVTLGTGLGSGLVIDKKVYNGATGNAAEIWCLPYKSGIIEDYVSGRGIKNIFRKLTNMDVEPSIIAERARDGHKMAIYTWKLFGKHLAYALSCAVEVVDPEIVVVGGSVSKQYTLFFPSMKKWMSYYLRYLPQKNVKVVPATLGSDSAVVGAAALFLK